MRNKHIFKRPLEECTKDNRVFLDPEIGNHDYVGTFGFEWTKIDGFVGKGSYVAWSYFWPLFFT